MGAARNGLNFEGYVLSSLLDEALSAANRRLAGMLGGRYAIRRREERERRTAAAGLDIEVLDRWNAQPRPAATLSGGEGFCASLALALGLAETVAAHAGARQLDALFIDEGFGTLDAETLDTAIGVLEGLAGRRPADRRDQPCRGTAGTRPGQAGCARAPRQHARRSGSCPDSEGRGTSESGHELTFQWPADPLPSREVPRRERISRPLGEPAALQ